MRRFLNSLLFTAPLLFFTLFAISLPIAAQGPPNPNAPGRGPNTGTIQQRYSVAGMVSDAESHTRIDSVRVDLRAITGGTVGTAFTSGNGNFQFSNIPGGSYEIVVEQPGYQAAHQQVYVQGPVFGIMIELRGLSKGSNVAAGNPLVSKRELSIPHKAQDAMKKGVEQLYGKSDYQGSIKQFERAIHEYPDYYEAYTQMGVAYMNLNDLANSERALRKALDLSDQHYEIALFWLASLFSNGQKFAEAEPLARKAVELNANSWEANSELARALVGLGRAAEAEANALAASKLRPENANLHLLLANIHLELHNKAALLDDLNAYLKLAPTGPFAAQARQQRDEVQQELQGTQASPSTPTSQNP